MNDNPKQYLASKGIAFRESGSELVAKCLFNGCDDDSRGNEAHLYFDAETGRYHCKKCDERGNLVTLAKHLGDDLEPTKKQKPQKPSVDEALAQKCHKQLPKRIRNYLNQRGISDAVIDDFKLGYGKFYGKHWITIPAEDEKGELCFRLRRDPEDSSGSDKFMVYPRGSSARLYPQRALKGNDDFVVLCEGEMDCLKLASEGLLAVTSTGGAGTFKEEWLQQFESLRSVYVCFDTDETGQKGAERAIKLISERLPDVTVYRVTLPDRMTDGKDITDYFTKYGGSVDELMLKLAERVAGPEPIDVTKFNPLTIEELTEVLGITIKKDEVNKAVTFLCQLSAYTDHNQFNIGFVAPSSTGKSFIPTEVAQLFPKQDVMQLGSASPTSFYHESGEYDKERNCYVVDLERKIVIFLDQPHAQLLERLRSLLSHDDKEIVYKITDKTNKHGTRTKTIVLRGFSAVIFCSAGLRMDDQEVTRFILLSPEMDQEKLRAGIMAAIRRETDPDKYTAWLDEHPGRKLLKERIRAIKAEGIEQIKIADEREIIQRFFDGKPMLKPRHQRDIKRFIGLVKVWALLNLWWREREGSTLIANHEDIEAASQLWEQLAVPQELNIPPYLFNIYQEVIVTAWRKRNDGEVAQAIGPHGITREDVLKQHYAVYGRPLDTIKLRQEILPMLEQAGLIRQEPDPEDKRKKLIFPITEEAKQNNSENNRVLTKENQ